MSLELRDLAVRYGSHVALEPTTLEFTEGEIVALTGPNGAGKTSLLRAIARLVEGSGAVRWNGSDIASFSAQRRARAIAYLPQSPPIHWPMTVRELVGLGRLPHRAFARSASSADREAVNHAMAQTNVTALADRPVSALSGGERARAQLARAICVEAPVLLVDEPVAGLDPQHQLIVMDVLGAYARSGRCVIAVMHDLTLAARFCQRIVLMSEGRVVEDGDPSAVLCETTVSRIYGVHPLISRHEGQPVVVPWRVRV